MKTQTLFLLIVILVLTSCGNTNKRAAIKKIDKLSFVVDSLKNIVTNDALVNYQNIKKTVDSNMIVLTNKNLIDLDNKKFMENYGHYVNCSRNIARVYKKAIPLINQGLELSGVQLKNLRHDIKKGFVTNIETIDKHIDAEEKEVIKLKNYIDESIETLKQQKNVFELSHSQIDSVIVNSN